MKMAASAASVWYRCADAGEEEQGPDRHQDEK